MRKLGDQVAGLVEVHRQLVRLAADDGRFDLRLERALALGEHVEVALGRVEPLLGQPQGVDLRLQVFEIGFGELAEPLAVFEAQRFAEPLLLGGEPGFVVAGLAFQVVALPLERLQPVALLAQGVDARGVADQQLVDAQPVGLVAKLMPLARRARRPAAGAFRCRR